MNTTDEEFIKNNICSIHDGIINSLNDLSSMLWANGNRDMPAFIDDIVSEVLLAKEKGIRIENRLKVYRFTIRRLGFVRAKEKERLTIVDNKLHLEPIGEED